MIEVAKKMADEEYGENKNHADYLKILKIQFEIAIGKKKY